LPLALAALLLLAPAVVLAQDPAKPLPEERRDTVMGTGGDATRTGRDPVTGDVILRATPQEQPREQYAAPPVVVQPEITLPAGKPKPAGQ
jgi:hypothetical protein